VQKGCDRHKYFIEKTKQEASSLLREKVVSYDQLSNSAAWGLLIETLVKWWALHYRQTEM